VAKKGMKRPEYTHVKPRNEEAAVQEIGGKAKHGKEKANPLIPGTSAPSQKVYHTKPYSKEREISSAYPVIDNDLARDNLENDLPFEDLQDL